MYPPTLDWMQGTRQSADDVTQFLDAALTELQQRHDYGLIMLDLEPARISYTPGGAVTLHSVGFVYNHSSIEVIDHPQVNHNYASPEQLVGGMITPQSDLYSLGVVAYELLTGMLPPNADQRWHGQPLHPLNSFDSVPPHLDRTITALLELNQDARPATAAAALGLLRGSANSNSASAGSLIAFLMIALVIGGIISTNSRTALGALPPPLPTIAPPAPVDQATNVPSGRVVFASNREGSYDLFLADAGGGPAWNLTASADQETAPALAATGAYIAYVAQVGSDLAIGRLDLDTMQRRLLTSLTPEVIHTTPMPSPDGGWIAYSSGPHANRDLYLMRADGSDPERVAGGPAQEHFPAWLPDGQRLVYVQQEADSAALILLDLSGSTPPQELYRSSGELQSPAVSPDGTRLAFAHRQTDQWDLYVLSLSSGAVQQITATDTNEDSPAWSADGTRLLFTATSGAAEMPGLIQLYISDANGMNRERIFHNEWNDSQPSWLP